MGYAFIIVFAYIFVSILGGVWVYYDQKIDLSRSWLDSDRRTVGLAPDPKTETKAVLQIYEARTYSWRGLFAVHPWIAYKAENSDSYTIIEILGWNVRRGGNAISFKKDLPDRKWYGNTPELIFTAKGEKAERIMEQINMLNKDYPYKKVYAAYPGPNSNTYLAYLIQKIPDLDIDINPLAIGQRYSINGKIINFKPGKNNIALTLWGHAGIALGIDEGIRMFLFGVEWGLNPWRLFIVVPGMGKIGL